MHLLTIFTALASLCWGVNAQVNPGYPTIDPTLFSRLKCAAGVGYTYSQGSCSASSIVDQCGATWEHIIAFNIGDGEGGTITVRLFRRQDVQQIYLFFPGSDSGSNFVADGNIALVNYDFNGLCSNCQVHQGFLGAFQSNKSTVISYTQYIMNANPNYNLVIAGGSLGGALAALFYAEFYSNWSYNLFPVQGISFGEPRVGNNQWAAFMNQLTGTFSDSPKWIRVTHGYDSVPRAPPPQYGYLHHSMETWAVDDITNGNRPDAGTTYLCPVGAYGTENPNCVNSGPPAGQIGDHVTYPGYGNEAAVCPS